MSNPEIQSQHEKVNLTTPERMAALGLAAISVFWAVMTVVDAYKRKTLDEQVFKNAFVALGLLPMSGYLLHDINVRENTTYPSPEGSMDMEI